MSQPRLSGLRGGHATRWAFNQVRPSGKLNLPKLIWASGIGEMDGPLENDPSFKRILSGQPVFLNNLADEGEIDFLDVYFNDQAVRASLFGRLCNSTLAEVSTETTVDATEPVGNGYTSVTYTRGTDWTPSTDTVVGAQKTYTASGGTIGPVTDFGLCTTTSGTAGLLIAYVALSATRTLLDGDSLNVDATVQMA